LNQDVLTLVFFINYIEKRNLISSALFLIDMLSPD
jgi:hypothetical protein